MELHYPSGFVLTDDGDRFDPSVSYQEPEGYDANAAAMKTAAEIFGKLDATPAPSAIPVTPAPAPTAAPVTPAPALPTPVSDAKSALEGLLDGGNAPVSDTKSALEGLLLP